MNTIEKVAPSAPLMNTYGRTDVVFVRGADCLLFDRAGKEYVDCLGGIAVISAGHSNREVTQAIAAQAGKLMHVSNLFWNEPMAELAQKLASLTGWGRVFFANSGAEANECAIKLARKWAGPGRHKILCAEGSFHGRTLGALAATGQPAKWKGFEPLPEGFVHLPFNSLGAFEAAIDSQTGAILVEPVQGERGVVPATPEFLKGLRRLADTHRLALIFDEIQIGMGRSGTWWSFQHYQVKPDIFTSAKGLANGLPIGACIADEPFASTFVPGDHATTFGGGAVPAAAALATIQFLESNDLVQMTKEKGEYFRSRLQELPQVKEVRGLGLLIGVVLKSEIAGEVFKEALDKGLVVNAVLPDTIRLAPPLTISRELMDRSASILESCLNLNVPD